MHAWPLIAFAQRKAKVAVLFGGIPEDDIPANAAFFAEMRRLGWIEGQNIVYERAHTGGSRERSLELARAAVAKKPDLIYAPIANVAVTVLKVTDSIPVVFISGSDPITSGLVQSLSRPGGNATGAYQMPGDMVSKRYELVHEALPRVQRLGVLLHTTATDYRNQKRAHAEASRPPGLEISTAEITTFEEIETALAKFKKDGISVVALPPSYLLLARRRDVAGLALKAQIALVAHRVEWAEAGALFSYGADIVEAQQRSALIADRILKGARASETPVVQASKFELVINLKTAKALGLSLPKNVLLRADRIIE